MKKKTACFLAILLVILVFIGIFIYRDRAFEYRILPDNTWEIIRYTRNSNNVKIPARRLGKPVTKIGDRCFGYRYFDNLTITGGENIEIIGVSAFASCNFADGEFLFPDSLKYIDSAAFKDSNLSSIQLNEGLKHIGSSAFECTKAEEVYIPAGVNYIGSGAFSYTPWMQAKSSYTVINEDTLILYPNEEVVNVPNGIKEISVSVNYDSEFDMIKEIYISNTVERINGFLIAYPETSINIYIPRSVSSIEYYDSGLIAGDDELVTYIVEKGSYGEEYAKHMAEKCGSKYKVVDMIQYPQGQ